MAKRKTPKECNRDLKKKKKRKKRKEKKIERQWHDREATRGVVFFFFNRAWSLVVMVLRAMTVGRMVVGVTVLAGAAATTMVVARVEKTKRVLGNASMLDCAFIV